MAKRNSGGHWFLWTFLAVLAGIWAWAKWTAPVKAASAGATSTAWNNPDGLFFGPSVDAQTGAYLPTGTAPGTSQFNSQPVGLQ